MLRRFQEKQGLLGRYTALLFPGNKGSMKRLKQIGPLNMLFCLIQALLMISGCGSGGTEYSEPPDEMPDTPDHRFAGYPDYAFDTLPSITSCLRCVDTPDHRVLRDRSDLQPIQSQIDFSETEGCDSAEFVNAFDFDAHTYLIAMVRVGDCIDYLATRVKQHPDSDTLTSYIDFEVPDGPEGCTVENERFKVVELSGVDPDQPINFYGRKTTPHCAK
jgi:hypothetical protein